jgi:hypothetical protein
LPLRRGEENAYQGDSVCGRTGFTAIAPPSTE